MSNVLYRWGRAAARHPWRMMGAWLVVGRRRGRPLRSASAGDPSDNFTIPGTEAQRGIDLLDERFPTQGGVSGQIVFADPDGDITDPAARAAVEATLARAAPGPERARRHRPVRPGQPRGQPRRPHRLHDRPLQRRPAGQGRGQGGRGRRRDRARRAGLQAEISRTIVRGAEEVEGKEGIGLVVAVVVLLVAFGSVIAAGIPIGTGALRHLHRPRA